MSGKATPKNRNWWAPAALVAALGASFCCLGPLLAAALGLGGLAWASHLHSWRPLLALLALGLLTWGWVESRRHRQVGEACCQLPGSGRQGWWVALVVLVLLLIPLWIGKRLGGAAGSVSSAHTAVLAVQGVSCAACAAAIEQGLSAHEGVGAVSVSRDRRRVEVSYDPARTNPQQLAKLLQGMGYPAQPAEREKEVQP